MLCDPVSKYLKKIKEKGMREKEKKSEMVFIRTTVYYDKVLGIKILLRIPAIHKYLKNIITLPYEVCLTVAVRLQKYL